MKRAARLTSRTEQELTIPMITGCDAVMGIAVGELYRDRPRQRDGVVASMVEVGMSLLDP